MRFIGKAIKKLVEASTLNAISMVSLAVPLIVGSGEKIGGAISTGAQATAEGLAAGYPPEAAITAAIFAALAAMKSEGK